MESSQAAPMLVGSHVFGFMAVLHRSQLGTHCERLASHLPVWKLQKPLQPLLVGHCLSCAGQKASEKPETLMI